MSQVLLTAETVDELQGKARYRFSRRLFLIVNDDGMVEVHIGIPNDVTDEQDDGVPTLATESVQVTEVPLRDHEDGVAMQLPERDELYEQFKDAREDDE